MNIYKFSDEVFYEVIDSEFLENSNGVKIKVNRYISADQPQFWFKDEKYFVITIGAWTRKGEVTEEEFREELEILTKKAWTEISEIEDRNKDSAFTLTPLSVSTRTAYAKTHGITNQEFIQTYYWDLRNGH